MINESMPLQADTPSPRITLVGMTFIVVIAGLIAGSILMHLNAMYASKMQANLSQIEKFRIASQAFKGKFGYLPGDIPGALAAQLKFTARDGSAGRGDGNGVLEGYVYSTHQTYGTVQTGEPLFYWEDLSSASLIKEVFNTAYDTELAADVMTADSYLPNAKLGNSNYLYVYSDANQNYYGLSALSRIDRKDGTLLSAPGLSVSEASTIDQKLDDGLPASGKVLARYVNIGIVSPPMLSAASTAFCFDGGANQYGPSADGESMKSCALSFAF